MSPVLLSAMRNAFTCSGVRSSQYSIFSSGISVHPRRLHASTRVCPNTMTGFSRDSRPMVPRSPNSLMESATAGIARSLFRAFRA